MGAIYKITNQVNGKVYIGMVFDDSNYERRINEHWKPSSKCYGLARAVKKYGKNNFVPELIVTDIPKNLISIAEQYWIYHFNSIAPNGYNLTYGGEGGIHLESTRKKLSDAHKGKTIPDHVRKKISETNKIKHKGKNNGFYNKKHSPEVVAQIIKRNTGRVASPETRAKMSKAQKGKVISEDTRKKISEAKTGQKYNLSPEERERRSQRARTIQLGRKHSEETKKKMSKAQKGKKGIPLSDEHKEKLRQINTGKHVSIETRKKQSEAAKRGWRKRKFNSNQGVLF